MRKIILFPFILSAMVFTSCCGEDPNEETHYMDTDFVLVQKNEHGSTDGDEPYIEFVIRTQEEPYMYRVLSNDCGCGGIAIDRDDFHKYEVGDLLHYDYIRRDAFFTKTNDIILDSEKSEIEKYIDDLPMRLKRLVHLPMGTRSPRMMV